MDCFSFMNGNGKRFWNTEVKEIETNELENLSDKEVKFKLEQLKPPKIRNNNLRTVYKRHIVKTSLEKIRG